MRPEDRDAASLWDALEAARRISSYVEGTSFDDSMTNSMMRAAVERELTTIGEALNRLSPAVLQSHPDIAVPAIVSLRNRIIHEYERIEHRKIFAIATERVPELIDQLSAALPPIPPDPESE